MTRERPEDKLWSYNKYLDFIPLKYIQHWIEKFFFNKFQVKFRFFFLFIGWHATPIYNITQSIVIIGAGRSEDEASV